MPLTIRAATEADLPATVAMRNLPRCRWGTLSTPFESAERWRVWAAANSAQKRSQKNLVACHGDQVVGEASLFFFTNPRAAHAASIGIHVHDDFQGQGIGTALFAALTDLADNWLNLRRLQLGVFADNAPAIALYKKFGFVTEVHERVDIFRDGAFIDSLTMARLRGDFPRDDSPPPPPATPAPAGPFTLRAAEPSDLPAINILMNQPAVIRNTLRWPFCGDDDNRHLATPADPSTKSIAAVTNGQVIGLAILTPRKNRQAHMAELSLLAVHDAYHHRGIGRALLAAALDVADNWLNLRRVELTTFTDNDAAIALYESAGFVAEGVKRADAFRNGAYADGLAMARLR